MKKEQRHKVILNEVQVHNRVLLIDLSLLLGVSIDTIRRDIKELDDLKKLKKVHGGAVSNGFKYISKERDIYQLKGKSIIAKKAISLIDKGNTVLISGGSTNLEFAKLIPDNLGLTFFTPSLPMAIELLENTSKADEVIFIGGKLAKGSQLATGGGSVNMLSNIKADVCFMGTSYIDVKQGITTVDWEIAQMKKAMIRSSKKVVSLSISAKLNTFSRYKICDINMLDVLVTELNPDSEILETYRKESLKLL